MPFGKRGPTVNAASPLVVGDQLFFTASYNVGAHLARLTPAAAQTVWDNDDTLSSQYSTAVHADGYLYGIHGREDVGRAALRCVRLADGQVMWNEPNFGMAHLIGSGDKLLILRVDGKLVLARTTSTKYEPLAQATISGESTRAMPALSGGRLVLRTNIRGGDGELVGLQVGAVGR